MVELANGSVSLKRRGLEIQEQQATVLAAALAKDGGLPEWDPVAATVARALLAANRSVFREAHRHLTNGASPREATEAARPAIARIFDLLEQGLADHPG